MLQGPFGETDLLIEHEAGRALAHIVANAGPIEEDALARLDGWVAEAGRRDGRRPKRPADRQPASHAGTGATAPRRRRRSAPPPQREVI
ncbi:MAG: hypothetical protein WDO24_27540 [Pseudomonadota bacterium]